LTKTNQKFFFEKKTYFNGVGSKLIWCFEIQPTQGRKGGNTKLTIGKKTVAPM
jgi:hypothetical protein